VRGSFARGRKAAGFAEVVKVFSWAGNTKWLLYPNSPFLANIPIWAYWAHLGRYVNRTASEEAHSWGNYPEKSRWSQVQPAARAGLALSPGYLRSEAMLDRFGVTEATWRDAIVRDPHVEVSESPAYIGRIVAALARDENVMARSGQALATWNLAKEFAINDADGSRPDWGKYSREILGMESG
jgi:hypothetical protein